MSEQPAAGEARIPEDEGLRTATSALIERFDWARSIGMTFSGDRDLYNVLGYDPVITAQQYRDRYARGGIAGRVVDALAKAVWRGEGRIFEDEKPEVSTAFEKEWDALNKQLRVWPTLGRAHILASLSSFSVLLLGAEGELSQELPRGKPGGILYLTPFGGGVVNTTTGAGRNRGQAAGIGADVTVQAWDENEKSPRFGQPLSYQLKRTNISSPSTVKPVHWTRVIHIPAPGFLDDAVFGPPALESVWNYLDDLDKVVGGGAEAFWLRANAGLHINIDKKMQLTDAKNTLEALAEQVKNYEHNLSRVMRTRGVDVTQLGSDVADFKQPSDAIVTLIAGTSCIPKRILTGSEMGQLASEQDRDNWNDQIKDCRSAYAAPTIVRQLIDRLVKFGYLTAPKMYEIEWPDIDSMSEAEKLEAAEKAAKLNDHGERVITASEIRETYLDRGPLEEEDEDLEAEEETVERLEAAIRKGGTLSLVVPGAKA